MQGWGMIISGTPFLIEGGFAVGIGGAITGGVIGGGANVGYQLTKNPSQFSYTDATVAAMVGMFTQGKSLPASLVTNMGGAYIGAQIKGSDPIPAVIGAGIGAGTGSLAGKAIWSGVTSEVSAGVREQLEAVGGSISSEFVSDKTAGAMEKKK